MIDDQLDDQNISTYNKSKTMIFQDKPPKIGRDDPRSVRKHQSTLQLLYSPNLVSSSFSLHMVNPQDKTPCTLTPITIPVSRSKDTVPVKPVQPTVELNLGASSTPALTKRVKYMQPLSGVVKLKQSLQKSSQVSKESDTTELWWKKYKQIL
jgi:hypothetical protein